MTAWEKYKNAIKRNCASPPASAKDIYYWRNNLFAGTIIYLLPFCLIALIPSLYWITFTEQYFLAVVDVVTVILMLLLAFIPGININTRKIIFIACFYMFSCIMLYYIGQQGPGLLFLLMVCILCTLIFPSQYAWWSAFLNTLICIIFTGAIFFQELPKANKQENIAGEWIAVSSNLVFLSFLSAALIPRLFKGLQQTLENEKELQTKLTLEQQSLEDAMKMLEQKNTDLEQFAYIASHDLQEPLRMVTGFLSQLEKKYNAVIDDKGKQYIHFAVDGAKRMQQLILDLLEFSRAGKPEKEMEPVNLQELVREIKKSFQKKLEEQTAIIHVSDLPVIHGHRSFLKQIFQNLVSNALKYSDKNEPPLIRIFEEKNDTHWQFGVSDNGIGIDPEYSEKIFVIFQRLHSNSEYPGTGLGLAICKKVIENMGGTIWVNSREGEGSTFHFTVNKNTVIN